MTVKTPPPPPPKNPKNNYSVGFIPLNKDSPSINIINTLFDAEWYVAL
jgi:hypothetical protein